MKRKANITDFFSPRRKKDDAEEKQELNEEKKPVDGHDFPEPPSQRASINNTSKLLTVPGFRSEVVNANLVRMDFVPPSATVDFSGKLRVCAFDMDHTVITTKQGGRRSFSLGPHDWKFLNDQVAPTLTQLGQDSHNLVVLFTNQSTFSVKPGSKSFSNLQAKFKQVSTKLGIPIRLYAAVTKNSPYRKPSPRMWKQFKADLAAEIDMEESFFVGDAAGRPGDFSNVDIEFAINCGLKFYTPEIYWSETDDRATFVSTSTLETF